MNTNPIMTCKRRLSRVAAVVLMLASVALAACKDNDDTATPAVKPAMVKVINVDVVLPRDIQEQWQNSIQWALDNIDDAQASLPRQVKLNLRYHDEDTEDLEQLAYQLTQPEEGQDTCHVILGPYHSDNAQTFLSYAARTRLPVVMPTCTSADLQRIHARNTYAWFLTESDITQCEIMLSAIRSLQVANVALIYSEGTYGKSFEDWFGYYATEFQLNIAGDGQLKYRKGADITNFLKSINDDCNGENAVLCVALSDVEDYHVILNQIDDFLEKQKKEAVAMGEDPDVVMEIIPFFTDTACDEKFLNLCTDSTTMLGITPYASLDFGFPQAYYSTMGHRPRNGEAQVFDALNIIALGAYYQMISPDVCLIYGEPVSYTKKPFEAGLTDYMRAIVSNVGDDISWDEMSLINAYKHVARNIEFSFYGATGELNFDYQTFTKALNTTYMIWKPQFEDIVDVEPIVYLSTAGTSSQASTTSIWEQEKRWIETNFEDDETPELPELADRWAVLISPSTSWNNYRHQADVFALYQTLRDFGYDDDHIVLIAEDNLAYDPRNKYQGQIFIEPYDDEEIDVNFNIHENLNVDYHFSDITPDDVADIMLGCQSERLPHVIHPTEKSDVLFFWSGHGGPREGPLWGNEDADTYFGTKRIRDIVEQMSQNNSYRRIFFAIEACYSGLWGEALKGLPNLLAITAANTHETSEADVYDSTLGVYLSNAFTRTFLLHMQGNSDMSIYELYRELARSTIGSHVTLYNQNRYGSVYSNTMREYFPYLEAE